MTFLCAAAVFWFWTGLLVGASLARTDEEVTIHEETTVRVEELPAEEDEVDGADSFADAIRN